MKVAKHKYKKPKVADEHGFRKQLDDSKQGHEYGKGLEIYVDGSCRPHNPGPGRYGFAVVENNNKIHEWVGGKRASNNAEMEVWALQAALMFIAEQGIVEPVAIHTDSGYCCSGYNSWMHNWVKTNWKGKKYPSEWKQIYSIWEEYPNVAVKWIPSHSGHMWNEYIDDLIGTAHKDKSLEIEKTAPIVAYKGPDKSRTEILIDRIKEGKEPVSITFNTSDRADQLLLAVYKEIWEGSKLYDDITAYLVSRSLIDKPIEHGK